MDATPTRPAPYPVFNAVNGEWMWDETWERRMAMKRRANLPTGEWSGLDREGRALKVVWVSSRWYPLRMLDVYEIYAEES